jgi:hypothetical protein
MVASNSASGAHANALAAATIASSAPIQNTGDNADTPLIFGDSEGESADVIPPR